MMREMIEGKMMSDEAAEVFLSKLVEIATQLGQARFHNLILLIIDSCDRRPPIATIRKMAGLRSDPVAPVVLAWEIVTKIVTRHLTRSAEGVMVLGPLTRNVNGMAVTESLPEIPPAIKRTVGAMGGWTALSEAYPQWWAQRFRDFKELYHDDIATEISLNHIQP